MRVKDFLDLYAMADQIYTVIVVYENGTEEEYEDYFMDEKTRDYIEELKFEVFNLYEQNGNKVLQIWL